MTDSYDLGSLCDSCIDIAREAGRKILEIYEKWIGRYTGQRPSLFEALIKLNATPE